MTEKKSTPFQNLLQDIQRTCKQRNILSQQETDTIYNSNKAVSISTTKCSADIPTQLHFLLSNTPNKLHTQQQQNVCTRMTELQYWRNIQLHVINNPTDLFALDNRGRNGLHSLCTKNPPIHVLKTFLRTNYEYYHDYKYTSQCDYSGRTPLSLAIAHDASTNVILHLLHHDPSYQATRIHDKYNYLPLHLVCMKSQPQHEDEDMDEERNDYVVLEALIQSNIESLQKLTMGNKSALHLAIECGASTSIIRLLIQSCPDLVTMDQCGSSPLQLAIRNNAKPDVFQLLVDANPSSSIITTNQADSTTTTKALPLHQAIEYNTSSDIITILCPTSQCALACDRLGRTSLHLVLEWRGTVSCVSIVKHLLGKAPEIVMVRNKAGITPLDMVYKRFLKTITTTNNTHNNGEETITNSYDRKNIFVLIIMLLEAFVTSLQLEFQTNDFTILHAALRTNVPIQVLQMIIMEHADTIPKQDPQFQCPAIFLPFIQMSSSSLQDKCLIMYALLKAYPDSALMTNRHGQYILTIASKYGYLDQESIRLLIQSNPEAIRIPDPISGLYPFMLAATEKVTSTTTDSRFMDWGFETNKELLQLNSIFELLIAAPDVLMYCL